MSFGVIQGCFMVLPLGLPPASSLLRGHTPGEGGVGIDPEGNARGKDLRVLPVWVPCCVC